MAPLWTALILLFTLCFESVKAGEYCTYGYFDTYYYCYYGCCVDSCCSFILAGWMIGLIAAGCIVFISIIVAVVFCCIKSKGQPGRVVQPLPHSGVTVISGANNSSTMQYHHHQQQQQPGYYGPPQGPYGPSQGLYTSGPPGYSQAYAPPPGPPAYSDPAYPPGQFNNATPFAAAAGKIPN